MAAVLMAKAPSPAVLRDIIAGIRYAGQEALDAGLVDGIGKDADEVVWLAHELAVQVAPKAAKGVRRSPRACLLAMEPSHRSGASSRSVSRCMVVRRS